MSIFFVWTEVQTNRSVLDSGKVLKESLFLGLGSVFLAIK